MAYIEDIGGNVSDKSKMTKGVSLKKVISKANTFSLSEDGGDMLGDLVDNTSGVLIVSNRAREVLEAEGVTGDVIEYLPFTLKDKRGRPTKGEFYVANPLQKIPCMNREKSKFVDSDEDGRILSVRKLTVEPKKIPNEAKLFRLGEYTRVHVVRLDLAQRLRAEKLTGLTFCEQGEKFTW
ncbi:hypothetical protein Q664_25105 [Archangium violaceum Cb vi76]|uniref:Immunity MXAN-0049 protein domain-containing protein n=1 Tax=Archangium violaceum Cb vi76 TaxID=1406225 RepID=A0A084SRB2_9BACT|nr:hypothetical protein Q664_25105 [Archangium violaceum Cb vi76]